jgi:hypothetical protein
MEDLEYAMDWFCKFCSIYPCIVILIKQEAKDKADYNEH